MSNTFDAQNKVKGILNALSPDQTALARTMATLKIENKLLAENLAKLRQEYDNLYIAFVSLLLDSEGGMIEISREAFERYRPEFRLESKEVMQELEDKEGNKITNRKIQFKLRTLIDK